MPDLFQTYFLDPIRLNTGYNIVNTAVYGLIFVALVFATYKLLKRMKIRVDRDFFLGIAPYVALGAILRAWEDLMEATKTVPGFFSPFALTDAYGVSRNLLFITPLIYIFMFALALAALIFAKLVEKQAKIQYHKAWFGIGAAMCVLALSQLRLTNALAVALMLGIFGVWALAILGTRAAFSFPVVKKAFTKENSLLILVHMFDATTTFVALQFFPYFEQHVVAGLAIGLLGPAGIFALKLPVVTAVLYYLDKETKNPHDFEKRNFVKLAVLVLGLGPGLRNFLRLAMGV